MFWWLPVVLLVVIALIQRIRVHLWGQSAWKGGGFAMFSEIPHTAVLPILCRVKAGEIVERIPIAPSHMRSKESIMPSKRALERLGTNLLRRDWQRCGTTAHEWFEASPGSERLKPDGVIVRTLRVGFDGRTGTYVAVQIQAPLFVQRMKAKGDDRPL
jgi:hypothetical protein